VPIFSLQGRSKVRITGRQKLKKMTHVFKSSCVIHVCASGCAGADCKLGLTIVWQLAMRASSARPTLTLLYTRYLHPHVYFTLVVCRRLRCMLNVWTDCEDDDCCGGDLRCLSAASARLLLRRQPASTHPREHLVPTAVPVYLLAGHEQRYVQSTHLLLDEWQVMNITRCYSLFTQLGPPKYLTP